MCRLSSAGNLNKTYFTRIKGIIYYYSKVEKLVINLVHFSFLSTCCLRQVYMIYLGTSTSRQLQSTETFVTSHCLFYVLLVPLFLQNMMLQVSLIKRISLSIPKMSCRVEKAFVRDMLASLNKCAGTSSSEMFGRIKLLNCLCIYSISIYTQQESEISF